MTGSELASVALGLASAASWGAGDFCGGLASRRANVSGVVIGSQAVGAVLLVGLALAFREPLPGPEAWLWGALAGTAGAVGLITLYRALASGRMGVVAPLSAVLAAAVPVLVAVFAEGLPGPLTLIGFGLALAAVWLLARTEAAALQWRDLGLPLVAGLGFGLFFVFIDRASNAAVLWPLVAARSASILVNGLLAVSLRQPLLPDRDRWPLAALAGALDSGGNTFFALATQTGRLDVASVLSSLYPASTVLLAGWVLKERLTRVQLVGVAAALLAIALIAL